MKWNQTAILWLVLAGLALGADRLLGPLGTRVTDQRQDDHSIALIAVASRWSDSSQVMDFVDTLKDTYEGLGLVAVDVVRRPDFAAFDRKQAVSEQEWQQHVLLSYRRTGDHETTVLAPDLAGPPAR